MNRASRYSASPFSRLCCLDGVRAQAQTKPERDQLGAEPVHDDRALLQDARGANVGIDERGRDRQGRPQHLGGRALRRQHVSRPGHGTDVEPAVDSQVRRVGQAGRELRSGLAHLSARHPRRSRRQRLGDRRSGRCATAGSHAAPGAAAQLASVRFPDRRAVIRSSNSAPTGSC